MTGIERNNLEHKIDVFEEEMAQDSRPLGKILFSMVDNLSRDVIEEQTAVEEYIREGALQRQEASNRFAREMQVSREQMSEKIKEMKKHYEGSK